MLGHIGYARSHDHPQPHHPIAAEPIIEHRPADAPAEVATKHRGAGVGNGILIDHRAAALFVPAGDVIVPPALGVEPCGIRQIRAQHRAVFVDVPRLAIGHAEIGVPIELVDQPFEQTRIGVIVGLGEPYILTAALLQPTTPLDVRAAAVGLVLKDADARVGKIALDHFAAVVLRSVIEVDDFDVLDVCPNTLSSRCRRKRRVIEVGNDDADLRRDQEIAPRAATTSTHCLGTVAVLDQNPASQPLRSVDSTPLACGGTLLARSG